MNQTDLEDRLVKIIGANFVQERFYGSTNKAITQILTAIKEAGYVLAPKFRDTRMTGQEWYERYLKEGQGRMFPYRTDREMELVADVAHFFDVAAKRAAKLNIGGKDDN